MNLEICTFTLNKCLVIRQTPVIRKVYVFSYFEPLGIFVTQNICHHIYIYIYIYIYIIEVCILFNYQIIIVELNPNKLILLEPRKTC